MEQEVSFCHNYLDWLHIDLDRAQFVIFELYFVRKCEPGYHGCLKQNTERLNVLIHLELSNTL